jgi:mRNA-degrading endonuclease YafQ of YafQ-DinJ toxin-antitoxin module
MPPTISLPISSLQHIPHTLQPLLKLPLFGTGKISTLLLHHHLVPITSIENMNKNMKMNMKILLHNSLSSQEIVKFLIPDNNLNSNNNNDSNNLSNNNNKHRHKHINNNVMLIQQQHMKSKDLILRDPNMIILTEN